MTTTPPDRGSSPERRILPMDDPNNYSSTNHGFTVLNQPGPMRTTWTSGAKQRDSGVRYQVWRMGSNGRGVHEFPPPRREGGKVISDTNGFRKREHAEAFMADKIAQHIAQGCDCPKEG